ncbi:flagellar biosynthesis anti-sigma factor FlgM [Variovorax sp. LARHSF232]
MKIDPPAPPALGPTRLQSKAGTPVLPGTGEAGAAQPPKESAPMSGQVRSLPSAPGGSDFDAARVAAIREDIRAGRYQVHPERIADGLLNSVRDLLEAKKKP